MFNAGGVGQHAQAEEMPQLPVVIMTQSKTSTSGGKKTAKKMKIKKFEVSEAVPL